MAAVPGLSATVYLDHNADPRLVADLRAEGYDAVSAHEVGMARATDEDHLRYATAHGRVIVTHDLRDFRVLDREWRRRGEAHAGIVLVHQPPRVPRGELRRRLLALLDQMTADELANRVVWLSAEP